MAEGILGGVAASAINKLPLQRRILYELQHDLVEWNHDGQLVRGRATGELFGAEAEPMVIGLARFVTEDESDVWEYPTKVLSDDARLVDGARPVPSLLDLMIDFSDLDDGEKLALRQAVLDAQPSEPKAASDALPDRTSAHALQTPRQFPGVDPDREVSSLAGIDADDVVVAERGAHEPRSRAPVSDVFSIDQERLVQFLGQRRFVTERLADLTASGAIDAGELTPAARVGMLELIPGLVDKDSRAAAGVRAAFASGYWIGRMILGTDEDEHRYEARVGSEADAALLPWIRGYTDRNVAAEVIAFLAIEDLVLAYARRLDDLFSDDTADSAVEFPIPLQHLLGWSGGLATALAEQQVCGQSPTDRMDSVATSTRRQDQASAEAAGQGPCGVCGAVTDESPCEDCGGSGDCEVERSPARARRVLEEARDLVLSLPGSRDFDPLTGIVGDQWRMSIGPDVVVEPIVEHSDGTRSPACIGVRTEEQVLPDEVICLIEAQAPFASLAASYPRSSPARYSRIAVRPGDNASALAGLVAAAWLIQLAESRTARKAFSDGEQFAAPTPHLSDLAARRSAGPFSFNADVESAQERWAAVPHLELHRQGEFFGMNSRKLVVSVSAVLQEHPAWGDGLLVTGVHQGNWGVHDRLDVENYVRYVAEKDRDREDVGVATDLLGSWCLNPEGRPAFVTFVPEPFCEPRLLVRLVDQLIGRFDWLRRVAIQDTNTLWR
jgi:hypothetical protein